MQVAVGVRVALWRSRRLNAGCRLASCLKVSESEEGKFEFYETKLNKISNLGTDRTKGI
jgi:hypothetical protein